MNLLKHLELSKTPAILIGIIGCASLISLPVLAQLNPTPIPLLDASVARPLPTTSTPVQPIGQPKAQAVSSDSFGKLVFQGQSSSYYLYTPKSYQPDQPTPLVIAFHGSHGSGRSLANATHLNDLAKQKGFIVVYPDGINYHWHQVKGYSSPQIDVDNAACVTALIEHLKQIRNIDSHRIYATGFSSGGILTQSLACQLSGQIAAFASVAGTLPANVTSNCQPQAPVSMLMLNGTGDESVPYAGGKIDGVREAIAVPQTAELWQQHNSCVSKANSQSGKQVDISRYSGCRGDSEVMLVTIKNIGHSWPSATSQTAKQGTASAVNANQLIWDFFQRHTLS
ncbi:MAG: dienelactone hydrolase family protein [Chroococcidiopsidaceae cyanobacterium CP_BM_RX_35]|nr:dienelactone hydrolase family protein [Chroococcidiopsidaceae cyanobacterium CP_BM_RX_35]